MPKIELSRLKKIIQEEISFLREDDAVDLDAGTKQMSAASKLLKALNVFSDSASEKSKTALGDSFDKMHKALKRIALSPMDYVDVTEPTPPAETEKSVTFQAKKSSKTL